jgi:hypothetical protein
MAAIYSNGGNRWNIHGFNFTKRDELSSLYKIPMVHTKAMQEGSCLNQKINEILPNKFMCNQ